MGGITDGAAQSIGPLTCEIVIIGSGSAGATAAWDLARAGREVVVLEEGGDYTGARLTQRDGRMYDQLYMDRGGRATADLGVTVLQGRVLGGGGVINACDVVPPPEAVLGHWEKRFGLQEYGPTAFAPFVRRAVDDLATNRPREDQLNRNNRLLRAGAQRLGFAGEVMDHNRRGCVGFGTCLLGCPADAKRNPRFVAIPGAVAAGARFFTRVRAVRIDDAGQELKTVRARRLDAAGYHEGEEVIVRAQRVILAANAIASAQLLLRSGIGNDHVGRHLSLQPQLPVTAIFPGEPVRFFRGIPQAYAVTEFERVDETHGLGGFRIEPIGGTPGIVASLLPRLGPVGKEQMSHYAQLAAVLCLVPDLPTGRVAVERSGRLRIHYVLSDDVRRRLLEAAKIAARIYLAAGATEVRIPTLEEVVVRREADLPQIDAISLRPATAPLLSAHQQGGVRMATSPRDGAANPDGYVHGARDVRVFDSALFPSSASTHTMTPIIALAHRLSAI